MSGKIKVIINILVFAMIIFGILTTFGCSTTQPGKTKFTVSTCPPSCDNDYDDFKNCDEINYDENNNKICTNFGRWP